MRGSMLDLDYDMNPPARNKRYVRCGNYFFALVGGVA